MIVYLCGGINSLGDSECKDWREYAKSKLNCKTLDPMRNDYRGIEKMNYKEIVESDINDIKNSDAILVNATKPSWGTAMEIVYAHNLNKEIIAFAGKRISPWLIYHCREIYQNIDDAIGNINMMEGLWKLR